MDKHVAKKLYVVALLGVLTTISVTDSRLLPPTDMTHATFPTAVVPVTQTVTEKSFPVVLLSSGQNVSFATTWGYNASLPSPTSTSGGDETYFIPVPESNGSGTIEVFINGNLATSKGLNWTTGGSSSSIPKNIEMNYTSWGWLGKETYSASFSSNGTYDIIYNLITGSINSTDYFKYNSSFTLSGKLDYNSTFADLNFTNSSTFQSWPYTSNTRIWDAGYVESNFNLVYSGMSNQFRQMKDNNEATGEREIMSPEGARFADALRSKIFNITNDLLATTTGGNTDLPTTSTKGNTGLSTTSSEENTESLISNLPFEIYTLTISLFFIMPVVAKRRRQLE